MPELVVPSLELYAAFMDCRADWGSGQHEDGFGIGVDDDLVTHAGFAAWVHQRTRLIHPAGTPCPAEPHDSPRWIVDHDTIVGAITLRHQFNHQTG